MSAKLFKADVLFLQRLLASSGLYKGPLDGKWSQAVETADSAFDAETLKIQKELGTFDKRTEGNILTLVPKAQKKAREFMNAVPAGKLTYRILSGTRTYAEQDALYAIGRTVQLNRKPVTKAKGGQSNHNFGIAWDVGIFNGGYYYEGGSKHPDEDDAYKELAALIKAKVNKLEWGGDWTTFVDLPHYQCATGKSEAQVRALLEKGMPYLT